MEFPCSSVHRNCLREVHGSCTMARMHTTAFIAAIREAGGVEAFRARLGVSRRTVFNWQRDGVPAEKVEFVSRITGLPPADLRPDLARLFQSEGA